MLDRNLLWWFCHSNSETDGWWEDSFWTSDRRPSSTSLMVNGPIVSSRKFGLLSFSFTISTRILYWLWGNKQLYLLLETRSISAAVKVRQVTYLYDISLITGQLCYQYWSLNLRDKHISESSIYCRCVYYRRAVFKLQVNYRWAVFKRCRSRCTSRSRTLEAEVFSLMVRPSK